MSSIAHLNASRSKKAIACAVKLDESCKAMHEFLSACNALDFGSGDRGEGDTRLELIRDMSFYADYLKHKYGAAS